MPRFLKRRQTQDDAGFSLLEVLLASLLFVIAFTGIAVSWSLHEVSLRKYRNQNAARFMLAHEMEKVMAHSYVHLEQAIPNETRLLRRRIDGKVIEQAFHLSGTIAEDASETLKDIVIMVSFEEQNRVKTMELHARAYRTH